MSPWLKRNSLNVLAVLHDAVMGGASFLLALYLRLSDNTLSFTRDYLAQSTGIFVVVLLGLLLYARTYRHIWRYTLEPVDGGTEVTETFDWAPAISTGMIERQGYPTKHPTDMAKTLERLDTYVTTGEVPTAP